MITNFMERRSLLALRSAPAYLAHAKMAPIFQGFLAAKVEVTLDRPGVARATTFAIAENHHGEPRVSESFGGWLMGRLPGCAFF
jgi:hypothetical protein